MAPTAPSPRLHPLLAGFHASWTTILLIAAINLGIAGVLWIDDPRPFWQPFVTVQLYGFAIAYCVNAAAPGTEFADHPARVRSDDRRADRRRAGRPGQGLLSLAYIHERLMFFGYNVLAAFFNGLLISLIFYVKFKEARCRRVASVGGGAAPAVEAGDRS